MYLLDCAPFEQPPAPEKALIMLHGYGANGNDLIGLAPLFREQFAQTLIIAPHAPERCPMTAFGRQWFALDHYNPARLNLSALAQLADAALPGLHDFLQQIVSTHRLDMKDIAILGFSQGTMMALKAAMVMSKAPAAVVGFSGVMPHFVSPRDSAFSVLLIHGTADSVVPFRASEMAHEQLENWGIRTRLTPREELGHSIDLEGIKTAIRFLRPYLR